LEKRLDFPPLDRDFFVGRCHFLRFPGKGILHGKMPARKDLKIHAPLRKTEVRPLPKLILTAVLTIACLCSYPAHLEVRPIHAREMQKPDAPFAQKVPRYRIRMDDYRIVSPEGSHKKIALLTIDDGPSGESSRQLLEVLERHQAKAIWFVNGSQLASKNQDGTITFKPKKAALLRDIKQRGHLIGNHTWQHANLRKQPAERQREEIISTNRAIRQLTGETPRYFRPPFGAYTDVSNNICREEGMVSLNWSVGSSDWDARVYKKPRGIARQVLGSIHPGATILFHDRMWTARELDDILTGLEHAGYQFVLPTEGSQPATISGQARGSK
jgi:peptidoglycan/xylan/chitin deacetylase (PgdA/CDA1 family)